METKGALGTSRAMGKKKKKKKKSKQKRPPDRQKGGHGVCSGTKNTPRTWDGERGPPKS